LVSNAFNVNITLSKSIINHIKANYGSALSEKNILVLGVAYKPNISDTRETPTEYLVDELVREGAYVHWHDPLVKHWRGQNSVEIEKMKWDVIILATAHDVFKSYDFSSLRGFVFDCTGTLTGVPGF